MRPLSRMAEALERNHPTGAGGVKCPWCGSNNNRVVDTNKRMAGKIRRKRVCQECLKSFRTGEIAER